MKKHLIFSACILSVLIARAQGIALMDSVQLPDTTIKFERFSLPPLDSCIVYACQFSPLLKASDEEIKSLAEDLKITRKSWLDYLLLDGNVRYGMYNQVTITDQSSGSGLPDLAVKANKDQLNYFGGLTLRLPLSSIITLNSRKQKNVHAIKQAQYRADVQRSEVSKVVVTEYFKMKRLYELLDIHQNNLFNSQIDYLKAKNDLKSGMLSITEFSTISTSYTKAIDAFITTKNDCEAQFYVMKLITGKNF